MIFIIQSKNPETLVLDPLRTYINQLGLQKIFPNFDTVRIGTVHPFAILLAQDVLNTTQQVNVFPSITIANLNSQEETPTIGYDMETVELNSENFEEFKEKITEKEYVISSDSLANIQEQIELEKPVYGIRFESRLEGSLDFNIWSDNKEITSFLFDAVYQFVLHSRTLLKQKGLVLNAVTGRRSGDINLDFGRLLYGANIQTNISLSYETIALDLEAISIQSVIVNLNKMYGIL